MCVYVCVSMCVCVCVCVCVWNLLSSAGVDEGSSAVRMWVAPWNDFPEV